MIRAAWPIGTTPEISPRHVFKATAGLRALVWKRTDFRETSRLITVVARDLGKFVTLGKGAHRPKSPCLGRIDFLNLVEIKISGGTLPILHRVKLLHEPRKLREPARFAAASYLTELFDPAFPVGRSDPALFDLLAGGILLLERGARASIPQIVAGIELRFLRELGLQPPLLACSVCGQGLDAGPLYPTRDPPGLACRSHAADGLPAIPKTALRWLAGVDAAPGRLWPTLPPAPPAVQRLLGRWIVAAIERQPRLRERAYAN